MFSRLRDLVLRAVRVPHDPTPPAGATGSLRVFRAGRNLYKVRLLRWAFGQIGALAGILISLAFIERVEREFELLRRTPEVNTARIPTAPASATGEVTAAPDTPVPAAAPAKKSKQDRSRSAAKRFAERSPGWLFPVLKFFEGIGILIYLVQIPITYAMVRLDFELRWYMVTDRSLRIRTGLASVQESTMSFANLQQVVVTQGPLQRLLGIADVRVQSAGGGGGDAEHKGGGESLHTGVFHGVENAHEIRDLIIERLRQFRVAGLGDPEDHRLDTAPPTAVRDAATRAAAQALLTEARALHRALA